MTLTEFLLARIADDEAAVNDCLKLGVGIGLVGWVEIGSDEVDAVEVLADRFSPARVLAECEAKRRIVKEHKPLGEIYDLEQLVYAEASATCVTCGPGDSWQAREYQGDYPFPCKTLTLLALPYADHDQFQPEWRVE